jgi:AcrR family transcriptional regulator
MGYRHTKEDLLGAAVAVALTDGIGAVTFASAGAQAGVSDRTVVYYFPDKAALIGAVVVAVSQDLQGVLDGTLGPDRLPMDELMRRSWPVLASTEVDPLFRVFLQVLARATTGDEPFRTLAGHLVDGWLDWVSPRIDAPTAAARRRAAAAVMAQLDGLLLLRSVGGAAMANGAARALGVMA